MLDTVTPDAMTGSTTQAEIFAPLLCMMLLTMLVWFYMYIRRLSFIKKHQLVPDQLTSAELARLSPPAVSNPSDNLKNLFEVPILFYAVLLYLYVIQQVDTVYLGAAGVFVGFRLLHSIIHCTINIVMVRFCLYLTASVALWFIIIRASLAHLGY